MLRRRRRNRAAAAHAGIQSLESRLLFAAGISLSGTRLTITGTAGADVIEAGAGSTAGAVVARLNDATLSFAPGAVTVIVLSGEGGNDALAVAPAVLQPATIRGGDGDDVLRAGGAEFSNRLEGGAGDDRLFGGRGDDKFDGGSGADFFSGRGGRDEVSYRTRTAPITADMDGNADDGEAGERDNIQGDVESILGGSGNDRLTGSDADNYLDGGPGDDALSGLGGDDDFSGEAGDDVMLGGAGHDSFASSDAGNDLFDGGEGNDFISSFEGDDRLFGGPGHDTLFDFSGANVLDGGPDPDRVGRSTEPGVTGGASVTPEGVLVVTGTSTSDTVSIEPNSGALRVRVNFFEENVPLAGVRSVRVETGGGDDRVNIAGFEDLAVPVTVLADDGDDRVFNGNASPVTADGGSGNDILTGGDGPDTLRGGSGNDQLFGRAGDDVLNDTSGTNVLDGGEGTDRVNGVPDGDAPDGIRLVDGTLFLDGTDRDEALTVVDDTRSDGPVYRARLGDRHRTFRVAEVSRVRVRAFGGNDFISIGVPLAATIDAGDGADTVFTSDADDVVSGGGGPDRISTGGGDDEIRGDGGNDIINGGRGGDRLFGGEGEDELTDPDGVGGMDGGPGSDTLNGVPDSAGARVTLEAEAASSAVGASVSRAYTGHTGSGYRDFSRDAGGYVEWTVDVSDAGTKTGTFRYANGGSSDRPLELSVNGQVVRPRLSFPPTGSWVGWKTTEGVPVQLKAGVNRIRITTVGSNGGNIDSMTLSDAVTPTARPLEAEQAQRFGADFSNSRGGYSGSGFVDYKNASGDWVQWTTGVLEEGEKTLTFRYANGAGSARPLELSVNGGVVIPRLVFESTGSWTNWQTVSVTVRLSAGDNAIRLTAVGSSGPNIDRMRVG